MRLGNQIDLSEPVHTERSRKRQKPNTLKAFWGGPSHAIYTFQTRHTENRRVKTEISD